MKYQVILENISRKPLETLKTDSDGGVLDVLSARYLFNESKDSVFCAHARLVSVTETGSEITMDRF